MKILSFGSLNIDHVYNVTHFVRPGETIRSTRYNRFSGGKGLNQSVALARAGAEVYHAGGVGSGDGEFLLEELRKNNINTDFVEIKECASGHAMIQVNSKGQNCILIYGGANQTIELTHIDRVLEHFNEGDFLVLQNEVNNLEYMIKSARQKGMKIALTPAPINETISGLPLEMIDYLLLNEVEGADISGTEGLDNILVSLSEKLPNTHIVLTVGKDGVLYKYRDTILRHGIYDVPVVDTTAAGDTFAGYFISSIAKGESIQEALRIASVAASISVSRQGAAPSIPLLQEVENSRLKPLK